MDLYAYVCIYSCLCGSNFETKILGKSWHRVIILYDKNFSTDQVSVKIPQEIFTRKIELNFITNSS